VTVITVATKADKIKRSQHAVHSAIIRDGLGLTATEPLVLFSSHTHNGRLTLWGTLNALLAPRQPAQGSAADTTSA
jgi:GTP-binding protein EngB required for normal cell division